MGQRNAMDALAGGRWRQVVRWLGAAALLPVLAACTTPYQPMGGMGGFTDRKLAPDRYSVEFLGNGHTSSQLVANMYLYRCAELTVQNHFDVFRSMRPDEAASDAWGVATLAVPAGQEGAAPTEFRSGGTTTYTSIYVPAAPVTRYRMVGVVRMGRYADVPSNVKVWDARAVMRVLEPVVRGSGRPAPLAMEEVARQAMVPGRGQPGTAGGGTSLDDLRRLLVQP